MLSKYYWSVYFGLANKIEFMQFELSQLPSLSVQETPAYSRCVVPSSEQRCHKRAEGQGQRI
jgi:uncharacterized protein YqgQ